MAAIGDTLRHRCPDEAAVCGASWRELAQTVRQVAVELPIRIGGRPR